MKKLLSVLLLGVLISYGFIAPFYAPDETGNTPPDGLEMVISNVSPNGLDMMFVNETDTWFMYGMEFGIFRKTSAGWRRLNAGASWRAIGYPLEPYSQTLPKHYRFDGLRRGRYMFRINIEDQGNGSFPNSPTERTVFALEYEFVIR
jgi:hypothetical protein